VVEGGLENQADAVRDAGENQADSIRENAGEDTNGM